MTGATFCCEEHKRQEFDYRRQLAIDRLRTACAGSKSGRADVEPLPERQAEYPIPLLTGGS